MGKFGHSSCIWLLCKLAPSLVIAKLDAANFQWGSYATFLMGLLDLWTLPADVQQPTPAVALLISKLRYWIPSPLSLPPSGHLRRVFFPVLFRRGREERATQGPNHAGASHRRPNLKIASIFPAQCRKGRCEEYEGRP